VVQGRAKAFIARGAGPRDRRGAGLTGEHTAISLACYAGGGYRIGASLPCGRPVKEGGLAVSSPLMDGSHEQALHASSTACRFAASDGVRTCSGSNSASGVRCPPGRAAPAAWASGGSTSRRRGGSPAAPGSSSATATSTTTPRAAMTSRRATGSSTGTRTGRAASIDMPPYSTGSSRTPLRASVAFRATP
jgi:hypothetical protein